MFSVDYICDRNVKTLTVKKFFRFNNKVGTELSGVITDTVLRRKVADWFIKNKNKIETVPFYTKYKTDIALFSNRLFILSETTVEELEMYFKKLKLDIHYVNLEVNNLIQNIKNPKIDPKLNKVIDKYCKTCNVS